MLRSILFTLFIICLTGCASLVVYFIWNSGPPSDIWFQIAGSFFIVGLASFLLWFSLTILSTKEKIENLQ